jgi:hypothetical protein
MLYYLFWQVLRNFNFVENFEIRLSCTLSSRVWMVFPQNCHLLSFTLRTVIPSKLVGDHNYSFSNPFQARWRSQLFI